MKRYKHYLIGIVILLFGILIGKISNGEAGKSTVSVDEQHDHQEVWTCSMHPQIRMESGGACPICGMDLIPLENNKEGSTISSKEVLMTAEAVQLANIQTTVVSRSGAEKEVRLLGTVKPDERRQYSQVSHLPGRIERLYVNFTGEQVRKGQRIVRLYSPELISAQKELFEALKSREVYPQLYKASRNKLKLWKLTDAQIDAIIQSGNVQEQIDILSDYSGYVMQRNVDLGDHVMRGMSLFEIANIDEVWVMFDAYESDLPWIKNGDEVEFNLQAIPGKTYQGKVTYIDPFVSATSRVAKVRVEVNNRDHKLLPEMFANGLIKARLSNGEKALILPKSAVLWTGKRAVVYVRTPHQDRISFEYREVVLGADLGGFYQVEKGLKDGEEVATNGVFRIDASAQLSGMKSMMNPGMTRQPNKGDSHFHEGLTSMMLVYMKLKDALVDAEIENANIEGIRLDEHYGNIDASGLSEKDLSLWSKHKAGLTSSLEELKNEEDLEKKRLKLKPLSKKLKDLIADFGWLGDQDQRLYVQYCPMADNDTGGYWLSLEENIRNPYFGESMLQCGIVKKTY